MNIPPAALEAGAMVLHDHAEIFDDVPWEDLSNADQQAYLDEARAAFVAMVEAWPGVDKYLGAVVLPLPQETRDDE